MHNRRIVWFQFHLCILMTFQTQQVCALKKWPKITANHTNLSLTHVNISNVNIQFGTKRAHQETKYVASKNNGLEAGCKVQHKYSKILFKSHIIKIAAVSKAFLLFPQSLEAVKSLNFFSSCTDGWYDFWDLPPSGCRENNGRRDELPPNEFWRTGPF